MTDNTRVFQIDLNPKPILYTHINYLNAEVRAASAASGVVVAGGIGSGGPVVVRQKEAVLG